MAEATRARGYEYFGVADHSAAAHYAGGLSIEEVCPACARGRAEARYAGQFRIFKGIEFDILADGSLDYPKTCWLASISWWRACTAASGSIPRPRPSRIVRAVSNPYTTILGHLRPAAAPPRGLRIDIEKVLEACAQHGVAVEINANPYRLDLDWRWHRRASNLGACSASTRTPTVQTSWT